MKVYLSSVHIAATLITLRVAPTSFLMGSPENDVLLLPSSPIRSSKKEHSMNVSHALSCERNTIMTQAPVSNCEICNFSVDLREVVLRLMTTTFPYAGY